MSLWHDYTTAALLGTGKSPLPLLPAALLATCGDTVSLGGEAAFLTRAGTLALWRQAGLQPRQVETALSPAHPEGTRPVSRVSSSHLRSMLGGHCTAVLPEWLREVARLGLHAPAEFLPALLERARRDRSLRPLALTAGGQRAQWLAAHNPDWSFATTDSPEQWDTGTRDQRRSHLRSLRAASPAEARTKIEDGWKSEPADVRAEFLAELKVNLSEADSTFLDIALDDRSKEVRRVAIDLLARLPSSAFVVRMLARAQPLLTFKRGGLLSRASLDINLPTESDPIAIRDGLDSRIFSAQKILGEKAFLLVLILSAVPLQHWEQAFEAKPDLILKAAEKNEFARTLVTGWTWATLRQRDAAWAEALLDSPLAPHPEFLPGESLLSILSTASQADRLAAALRGEALKRNDPSAWQVVGAQLGGFPGEWPPVLAREVLTALRRAANEGFPWHLRAIAESLVTNLPPSMLAEAACGWPIDRDGVSELVELLAFRNDALTALTQP